MTKPPAAKTAKSMRVMLFSSFLVAGFCVLRLYSSMASPRQADRRKGYPPITQIATSNLQTVAQGSAVE